MLVSYSHSFIFFHVAKVAGTSIRHALEPYTSEPSHFRIKRPVKEINGRLNPLYEMWSSALTHATVKQTQQALPDEFERFFSFAFVRNPWDWQVSMYHFLLQETDNPRYTTVKQLGGFKQYLEWLVNEENPYPKGATKLQKSMLVDDKGRIVVDRIGRYENLAEDFQTITASIGLDTKLPIMNTSSHRNYRDYYDTYTQQLVAKHFAEDIDAFEYTFN